MTKRILIFRLDDPSKLFKESIECSVVYHDERLKIVSEKGIVSKVEAESFTMSCQGPQGQGQFVRQVVINYKNLITYEDDSE
jgi:hypothetical protein